MALNYTVAVQISTQSTLSLGRDGQ